MKKWKKYKNKLESFSAFDVVPRSFSHIRKDLRAQSKAIGGVMYASTREALAHDCKVVSMAMAEGVNVVRQSHGLGRGPSRYSIIRGTSKGRGARSISRRVGPRSTA